MVQYPENLLTIEDLNFTFGQPDELKYYISKTEETWITCASYCKLSDANILLLLSDELNSEPSEYEVAILYSTSDINTYYVQSRDPFVVASHYGASLGFIKNTDRIEIVALEEGDDGWDERLGNE